jgi:hypothetical protein
VLLGGLLAGCGGAETDVKEDIGSAAGQDTATLSAEESRSEGLVAFCEDLDYCPTEGATIRCIMKPNRVLTLTCRNNVWVWEI